MGNITLDQQEPSAAGSVQIFVHWKELPNGLQATCTLAARTYVTVMPVDVTATAVDSIILGHFGLNSRSAAANTTATSRRRSAVK